MFKKAVLTSLAVMLIVFGASLAHALNTVDGMATTTKINQASVNPGGLGDALIYGYYNVRGNLNLFNIVNISSVDGAKVRVVFRNAKTSKECLDFTVCLSRGDVWTAYLVDDGITAHIYDYDTDTITAPLIAATGQAFIAGSDGDYTVTPDDCREGYFEVIGLNSIPAYDKDACVAAGKDNTVDCPVSESKCRDQFWPASVGNSLMGNNTIVESASLATYSYNATAIADFSIATIPLVGGVEPNVGSMDGGCTEADYILMKTDIVSPYDLIAAIGGETEVILTFPTRKACHELTTTVDMFQGKDTGSDGKRDKYCTTFGLTIWDDAEHNQNITDFSPNPESCLPYELNVLRIGGSAIWNSTVALTANTTFSLGWLDINLTGTNHNVTHTKSKALGLPTIAYTTQYFGGAASYLTPAAYKTNIGGVQFP